MALLKVFCIFFTICGLSVALTDLRCYICDEQETANCADPVDVQQLTSAECKSLNYGDTRKLSPFQSKLKSIIENPAQDAGFSCIKVRFFNTTVNKEFTARTCYSRKVNIGGDICTLIEEELAEHSVKACEVCDTENCNVGYVNTVSTAALLGVVFAAFITLLIEI